MKIHKLIITIPLAVLFLGVSLTLAQPTAFTYQGRLTDSSIPANTAYDMQFQLFNGTGTPQGSPFTPLTPVNVTNGIFTVEVDFGFAVFSTGAPLFLEVSLKPAGSPGSYTPLGPRQRITSVPYAVRSSSSQNADNAASLGGVQANQYVQTGDLRLTNDRNPTAGSTNYIQNQDAAPQASSNFNISGNGTAAGTISGAVVNAATQYNIGGVRILSNPGINNIFVGRNVGPTATGIGNSFFGDGTGRFATTGQSNSFFGSAAGFNNAGDFNSFFGGSAGSGNTTGMENSFFGQQAGNGNVGGSFNTFVGIGAGSSNVGGSNNTAIGNRANMAGLSLSNATAIGANASVAQSNSLVLGSIAGVNGATASTNVGIGTTSPTERLDVRGGIKLGTGGEFDALGGAERLRLLRGEVSVSGGHVFGSGWTSARTAGQPVGDYTVTFTTAFAATPSITATARDSSALVIAVIASRSTTSVRVRTFNSSGALVDENFMFTAVGPW